MKKDFVFCTHCGDQFFMEDTVLRVGKGRVCTICAERCLQMEVA